MSDKKAVRLAEINYKIIGDINQVTIEELREAYLDLLNKYHQAIQERGK